MENLLSQDEMNAIIDGNHSNVFAVLGIHRDKGSKEIFIRTYQPNSQKVELLDYENKFIGEMLRLDDRGFYQINLGKKQNFKYRFRITNDLGAVYIVEDVYRFEPTLGDIDMYLFSEGNHHDIYKKLGAHVLEIDGIKGVAFAVWAPNAKRVSVVGNFNNWDGRVNVMRKHFNCGVWDIFIPNIVEGEYYKFEVKTHDGYILTKSDPMAFYAEKRPNTASIVYDLDHYNYQ